MKRLELRKIIKEEILKEYDVDTIRNNPGFTGAKFAKKANDDDLIKMVQLKDKRSSIYNSQILPINKEIVALNKKYGIRIKLSDLL